MQLWRVFGKLFKAVMWIVRLFGYYQKLHWNPLFTYIRYSSALYSSRYWW